MVVETVRSEQTWRLLWSHASYQVISTLPTIGHHETICAGYGWGFRNAANQKRAVLVHPTADGREIGDLSLTILGVGTQVIPRCNTTLPQYLDTVRDVVQTAVEWYLR